METIDDSFDWGTVYRVMPKSLTVLNASYGNPERYADLMIAGFLDGVPGIVSISARGDVNFPDGCAGTKARLMGFSCFGALSRVGVDDPTRVCQ
jgi:hypothetical protein